MTSLFPHSKPLPSERDAFGRVRASGMYTLYDAKRLYEEGDSYTKLLSGGGSTSYSANESALMLTVSATGDSVIVESNKATNYQPGKSLYILQSFVFSAAATGLRQRVGYFDSKNGVFLELLNSTLYLVLRSYTSGAVVETRVPQSSWSDDKMNGLSESGINLDITKAHIFSTDFEWLGAGSVRCGFTIGGKFYICHSFHTANIINKVYMTSANLPVRYEIHSLSDNAMGTMKQICACVNSEGGYEKRGTPILARLGSNKTVTGSFIPLISVKLNTGRENAIVVPNEFSILPTSGSATYELVLIRGGTLTGSNYTVSSLSGNLLIDYSSTAISGGTMLLNAYLSATSLNKTAYSHSDLYSFDIQLRRTLATESTYTAEPFTLAARSVTSASETIIASMLIYDS